MVISERASCRHSAEWRHDARSEITMDQLLRMSSGLAFQEDYVDGGVSDVIPMLMFEGRHDTGAYAAARSLEHSPGEVWSYSSGTTNIICRLLKEIVGGGASGMLRFMNDELFEPIGIRTATPKFDTSGTFIGSSFPQAIPRGIACGNEEPINVPEVSNLGVAVRIPIGSKSSSFINRSMPDAPPPTISLSRRQMMLVVPLE